MASNMPLPPNLAASIPRPLTFISLPDNILKKVLFYATQIQDQNTPGERVSFCSRRYDSFQRWLVEPLSIHPHLHNLALESFLDSNVFYINCGPTIENGKANFFYGDPVFTAVVKYIDLRLKIAGIQAPHRTFDLDETEFFVQNIGIWARGLWIRLPKVESLSLWLDAETRHGGYRHKFDTLEDLVAVHSDTHYPDTGEIRRGAVPSAEAKQVCGTLRAVSATLGAFAKASLRVRSVSFAKGWNTKGEVVKLSEVGSTARQAVVMTREGNEKKQFLM